MPLVGASAALRGHLAGAAVLPDTLVGTTGVQLGAVAVAGMLGTAAETVADAAGIVVGIVGTAVDREAETEIVGTKRSVMGTKAAGEIAEGAMTGVHQSAAGSTTVRTAASMMSNRLTTENMLRQSKRRRQLTSLRNGSRRGRLVQSAAPSRQGQPAAAGAEVTVHHMSHRGLVALQLQQMMVTVQLPSVSRLKIMTGHRQLLL